MEPPITVTPDPALPLPAGVVLGQARALHETAGQTHERTLAMRQENQALLSPVRQHMLRPHEPAAATSSRTSP